MTDKEKIELIKAKVEHLLEVLKTMGDGKNDDYFRSLQGASMLPLEALSDYIRFIEGESL